MPNNTVPQEFNSLSEIAQHYRDILEKKKYIICFAHNGTGKTRLSMEFKNIGKQLNQNQPEELQRDTLYFNAFTEDLFIWDNDLENDNERVLRLNSQSKFFNGLHELPMEEKIQFFLRELADFDFKIDYSNSQVSFYREFSETMIEENIKISRGEENIFKWCFFLAIVLLALEGQEAYKWVKYIYIDDPISSLDEQNVINIAYQINKIISQYTNIPIIISTHHTLFFSVISHFFKKSNEVSKIYLNYNKDNKTYKIINIESTPFFHHIALLAELEKAVRTDKLYTYHFNTLRSLLEKTASFHGFTEFADCIIIDDKNERDKDRKKVIYTRLLHTMSHGGHSLFEPVEMVGDNKQHFKELFYDFLKNYKFNKNAVKKLG